MKKYWFKTVLACLVSLFLTEALRAAEKNGASPEEQLAASLAKWKELKATCQGNYSYRISFSSWVGFGHETQIVVENNKVVERRFKKWSGRLAPVEPGKTPKPDGGENWTERGADLGKHKEGAPLKTLDELYEEADKVVSQPVQPFERLYVKFDKQGLLNQAFKIDTRIADDAPKKGVSIQNVVLNKPKTDK